MGLSRLDNFLKSVRGTVLYVDPNSLDSTDSIENQGNSLTRPFKTIQRALIESARFSYQSGLNNDRFGKTTIMLYPGDHIVDNRPGWIPDAATPGGYRLRDGTTSSDFEDWDLITNFDLTTENNCLYKMNSIHGGVIIPRGTSIVGLDLRKTKIRPTYVPNPENSSIERSCIFRVTGGCYLWQFTVLDADPNGVCYKDYTRNTFVPNFSHHKLAAFEYADGINKVSINDDFLYYTSDRTDLEMYYDKVGQVYGAASGREIPNDYPSADLDIQPTIDEYRIVGSRGSTVGISTIIAGDGTTATNTITVTVSSELAGLNIDSPIQIDGVQTTGYNGQFVISKVLGPKQFQYKSPSIPTIANANASGATLNLAVDTVSSASPYVFNISLRSVYGMCGLLGDGNKSDGFKSIVVAQYTGIGLQKDDNAFVKYNSTSGQYEDSTTIANLHSDPDAKFKPEYENFHIKVVNNAYMQLVSVFAIGYASHFVAENGGDFSINNSNSNFGAKALVASGFRPDAFPQDDVGYVSHIIPPKEISSSSINIEFGPIDVETTIGVGDTTRLYLYNEKNIDVPPANVIDGFRIGSKADEKLNVEISLPSGISQVYSSPVVMPYLYVIPGVESSLYETPKEKINFVAKKSTVGFANDISGNIITFLYPHQYDDGESIRIISADGHLPDGLNANQVYYAITNSPDLNLYQIKVAQTYSDALNGQAITINDQGGTLYVTSRVSDKNSGDVGHPIQWDSTVEQWYLKVSSGAENEIYPMIVSFGTAVLGGATPRTYITRTPDSRGLIDTIYRIRYVLPKDAPITARPPLDGFVLQYTNDTISTDAEVQKYFNPTTSTLSNVTELRNPSFISNATWYGGYAFIDTELPHNLKPGSQVELNNVQSSTNLTGLANTGYNSTYTVVQIDNAKQFTVICPTYPGTFTSNTSNRNTSLPYFKRKKLYGTYQIYRSQEIKKYVKNNQDGVYHLIVTNTSNSPTVEPFTSLKFPQPIQNLYPQIDRDNPVSDPLPTQCFADSNQIGKVVVNDPRYSISKETLGKGLYDVNVAFGLTSIVSNTTGTAHTFYTAIDHGFAGITSVSILSGGSGYTQGNYYNASLVGIGTSITGSYATALVTVGAAGTITKVQIMDGGSAYGIGNTLSVTGIGTIGSGAVVRVTNILNNVDDTLSVLGIASISPNNYLGYNTLYRIVSIPTGRPKQLNVVSSGPVGILTDTTLGADTLLYAGVSNGGRANVVSSLNYDSATGITTLTFTSNHSLKVNNKFRLVGSDDTNLDNRDYVVVRVNSPTALTINPGFYPLGVTTTGTMYAFKHSFSSSGGDVSSETENITGRIQPAYAGITTTIGATILSTTSDSAPINIRNAVSSGFKQGDFIIIDDEIMRIKTTVTNDLVYVFRAILGSVRQTHTVGASVRRITVPPFEIRRNSIIRASGHTFEYMGYGPGNYSTALPERQTRVLTAQEELNAQASKLDGGICIFTGMDSKGNFFTGNKKINSATGQEEVYDAPIPTITGEDPGQKAINVGFDVLTPLEITISRSLRVEGGPNRNLISQFDGPVVFNGKITSNAINGLEAQSIYIQGDATVYRKFTVGISTPGYAGNSGDVVFNAKPDVGGFAGWIYTKSNTWEPYGRIFSNGLEGVGVSSAGNTIGISSLINFVGIGLTLYTQYDSTTGVSTVVINGAPSFGNLVGVSTGTSNNYSGIATVVNFVGSGISVTASTTSLGISTVTFSRIIPDSLNLSGVVTASKFVKTGAAATNFLKADGSDALITYSEVVNALGFTPANIAALPSDFPEGNSLVIDDLNAVAQNGPFNGTKTDFKVNINGIAYTTRGTAANLIISIGGVIQKPGTDYDIVRTGTGSTINTNVIRFTTAPATGVQNFGVALGGQGSMLSDKVWDAKGDLVVGYADNAAEKVSVGINGSVLTADSTQSAGVKWNSINNIVVGYAFTAGISTNATRAGIASTATNISIASTTSTDSTAYPTLVGNATSTGQSPFIDAQHLYYDGASNVLNVLGGANVGVLTATRLSVPGTIVQVVSGIATISVTHTSSYASTGLSTSITPKSSSNKILVLVNQPVYIEESTSSIDLRRIVVGSSTTIAKSTLGAWEVNATTIQANFNATLMYLDSPNTTGIVTYTTFGSGVAGLSNLVSNRGWNQDLTSSITLLEVSV